MKAREAFASGRYDDALDLFAKLYAETLHPVYLRNIGRCHQKMRQPEKAIDKFREYLAKEKKISADERKEIDGYIKEMEAMQEEQARQATPPPRQSAAAGDADQSNPAAAAELLRRAAPASDDDDLGDAGVPATASRGRGSDIQEVVVLDRHRRRRRRRGRCDLRNYSERRNHPAAHAPPPAGACPDDHSRGGRWRGGRVAGLRGLRARLQEAVGVV